MVSRLLGCGTALVASFAEGAAQSPVPVRELTAASATSSVSFGNVFGIRQLAEGRLLVNDGIRRQLIVLDARLAGAQVVIDSMAEGRQGYGPRAAPLIPYLADSTLFVDGASLSLLVIDPQGRVARVMSAPRPTDLGQLASSTSGIDARGRLIYRSRLVVSARTDGAPTPSGQPLIVQPDSAPIIRANFNTRQVDTIARVKISQPGRTSVTNDAAGRTLITTTINPLQTIDEFAVLSDGTVAIVRGHDYHIDWILPDGRAVSSAKLPFDWKRLTDADKQGLIDSARADQAKRSAGPSTGSGFGAPSGADGAATAASSGGTSGGRTIMVRGGASEASGGSGSLPSLGGSMALPKVEFVPLKDIADYYPPIRAGAAKADADGRLWILPTTSAQSRAGELIHDVTDNRGKLLQRVRLPLGRSIAGFGKGGIVYLMYRDGPDGWYIERSSIKDDGRAETR